MMTTTILPPPPPNQAIADKAGMPSGTFWKWLDRLRLTLVQFLPPLGTANQILGVNAAGTANEYKTINDGNGIDISHAAGSVTIAVNQMELANILAFSARH